MDQPLINRIVEAALLASSQPLTLVQLAGLFPLDEPAPEGSLQTALETLQAESAGRGVELVEVASGWRYQVQADVHPWVARLWTERQTKYTRATLETLALIAYRQPITRGEIEQVRGVATNSNIIKALEEREWIRVVGHRDMPGRPELLGTTKAFLDYFGLKRLDELPPLSELKDFGELEPQFEFEGERAVGGVASGDGDGDARAANDPSAAGAEDSASEGADADASDARDDAGADETRGSEADAVAEADVGAAAEDTTGGDTDAEHRADTHIEAGGDTTIGSDADAGGGTGPDDSARSEPASAAADEGQPPHPTAPSRIADRDHAAAEPDALADDGDSTGVRHE